MNSLLLQTKRKQARYLKSLAHKESFNFLIHLYRGPDPEKFLQNNAKNIHTSPSHAINSHSRSFPNPCAKYFTARSLSDSFQQYHSKNGTSIANSPDPLEAVEAKPQRKLVQAKESLSKLNVSHIAGNIEKIIRGRMQNNFRTVAIGSILITAWLTATFGKQMYNFFTEQTAEVAKETLRQESLQTQTQELATAVVQTLLNDKEVMRNAAAFLREAAGNDETRNALVGLALHILQHPDTLQEAVELGRKVVVHLAKEPSVINNIAILMTHVLKDDRVKKSASELVHKLSLEEEVYDAVVELTKRVLADESVNAQVVELLSKSSFSVLEDEEVISHSKEFITEVVTDDSIQRKGGQALWKTIYYSMQPHVKKIAAGSFIITSIIVFSIVQNNR
mmetsp:Transcript_22940/g.29789  ORF Transcript_22940/g.29789 Transcript_22940/m.29789 type:complete len:392 (+) Transcript_22940:77-1252(+)